MDDDGQEELPTASGYLRHRSPAFSRDEVKVLLSLIEKYKIVILNKSTSAAVSHAKDVAWGKIAKAFNDQRSKHERTAECLKIKWDNMKKYAKKLSKNLLDVRNNEFDDVTSQIVSMMCEAENNNTTIAEYPMDLNEDINDIEKQKETDNSWENEGDKNKDSDDNDGDNSRLINRSMNFTPEESSLLIKCVRQEKKLILSKANTTSANNLKNRAWDRITDAYNKLSPQERSTKVLRTKFSNIKRLAKCVNFKDYIKYFGKKHQRFNNDTSNNIKEEPFYEHKSHSDPDSERNDDVDDNRSDVHERTNDNFNFIPDPLSTVLNSDSGIDLINPLENKEAVRLKTELLNFKMETAKLERKRIEDAMRSETVETAFKLRTARLEAVAAAMKLPPSHPALAYTVEEAPAQQYLGYNKT